MFALTSAFVGTVCDEWVSFSCVHVFSALYVFTFPCRGQSSTIFLHCHLCCAPAAFVSIPPGNHHTICMPRPIYGMYCTHLVPHLPFQCMLFLFMYAMQLLHISDISLSCRGVCPCSVCTSPFSVYVCFCLSF